MGNLLTPKVEPEEVQLTAQQEKELLESKDSRRRNSFAFYITKQVNLLEQQNKQKLIGGGRGGGGGGDGEEEEEEGGGGRGGGPSKGEWNKILMDIKAEQTPKIPIDPKLKNSKFAKLAEAILMGNMRELRNQVIINYKTINRHYKEPYLQNTLLHFVCQEGYLEMLKFMLDDSTHSEFDETVLEISATNVKFRIPLHHCFMPSAMTFCGQTFGVEIDGSAKSERPDGIEVASDWVQPGGRKEREECIAMLIAKGADVNQNDYHNFYAIHYATIYGWEKTVRALIVANADVNAQTIVGKSALMFAVEYKRYNILEMLAANPKTNIDAADCDGVTALFMAVDVGDHRAVEILLKNNADTNVTTHDRRYPLKVSCKANDAEMVGIKLLERL